MEKEKEKVKVTKVVNLDSDFEIRRPPVI